MTLRRTLLTLTLLIMTTAACAESTQNLPDPVQAIQERGVQIVGEFEAPGGLTGYAGIMGRKPVAIYVTENGQYAIVGSMLDASGEPVNRDTLQEMVVEPMSKRIWSQLENSNWVADGDTDAPRTVYVFSDANCPYCHVFWKRARPWVKSGKVQLRHILVGVISETSDNKAATILTAGNPKHAYTKNEQKFAEGGIEPTEDIPKKVHKKLVSNMRLMRKLGIRGTPGIVYRDDQGHVQIWSGAPPKQAMSKVLGER